MEGFFERVYTLVQEIPRGKVASYGQIAKMLSAPRYSQIVGYALHANPKPGIIPCHRVVNRMGEVSGSFAFGGDKTQQKLLEEEGIKFGADGRIDMKKYQWKPELLDIE